MKEKIMFMSVIVLLTCFHINVNAQGKAPWTVTKHWITPGGGTVESMNEQYMDAWIYGKKAKGRL